MAKIITIFGAGASYDSLNKNGKVGNGETRPPLTDKLFEPNRLENTLITRYLKLGAIVPEIRDALSKGNADLESILGDFWKRAQGKSHRLNEISEVSRYIAHRLRESSSYISFGSNYQLYANYVLDNGIDCLMVTFNYDTLAEDGLSRALGISFGSVDSYMNSQIPLIKVHGSCNWYKTSDGSVLVEDRKKATIDDDILIGLPIVDVKTIVCPDSHLDPLREGLRDVRTIVVVGWRGKEPHFFEELVKAGSMDMDINLVAVTESTESCYEIHRNFQPYFRNVILQSFPYGFGGFIDSHANSFLSGLL